MADRAALRERLRSLCAATGRPLPAAGAVARGTGVADCAAPAQAGDAASGAPPAARASIPDVAMAAWPRPAGRWPAAVRPPAAATAGHAARSAADRVGTGRGLPGEAVADGVRLIELRLRLPKDLRPALDDPLLGALFGSAAPGVPLAVDTETTGLAGGTGTVPFLLGQAMPRDDALIVRQWLLTRPGAEAAMLALAGADAARAAVLLSFNGRCFDLPLLATRCRLHRIADPWAGRPHWDLLNPLRAAFARRWPDCRLRTAERRLLGFERVDDVPGALAQQAWFAFLRHGALDLLRGLIAHNRQDLESLYALLPALRAALTSPARCGADAAALARRLRAAGAGERAEVVLAGAIADPGARVALVAARRRSGRHAEAWALLAPLLARADAPVRLLLTGARLAEHGLRDPVRALACARAAAQRAGADPELVRRIARLERKCAQQGLVARAASPGAAVLPPA